MVDSYQHLNSDESTDSELPKEEREVFPQDAGSNDKNFPSSLLDWIWMRLRFCFILSDISYKSMKESEKMSGNILQRRKYFESEVDLKEMIVIDNGTETVKIGRSGVDYPSVIIDTISGYPHVISENDASPPKKIYFGKELAQVLEAKKYNVEFGYPI